jgi:hypothetical protein
MFIFSDDYVLYRVSKTVCAPDDYNTESYLAQSDYLAADRQGQRDTRLTLTPSVIPNSKYVIMVRDWNCLKYFACFLFCNHQVHSLFDHPVQHFILMTLYNTLYLTIRLFWLYILVTPFDSIVPGAPEGRESLHIFSASVRYGDKPRRKSAQYKVDTWAVEHRVNVLEFWNFLLRAFNQLI